MPLPTIATPTYELILPSNEKKIKFRPFLVKEEKILIIALESKDVGQITSAVKQVISEKMKDRQMSDAEKEQTAEVVSIGAIKY